MGPPRKTSTAGGKGKKKAAPKAKSLNEASTSKKENTPIVSTSKSDNNLLKPPSGPGGARKNAEVKSQGGPKKGKGPARRRSSSVNRTSAPKQPPKPPSPPPFQPLYPMDVLVAELRGDDLEQRLANFRKISTIALALGPEKTRYELIPFLTEDLYDVDEVMMTLAEQLAKFAPLIGGPKFIHILLKPLENLAIAEETLVREKAIESLKNISEKFTSKNFDEHFYPMVLRMASEEWFTARASSCALIVTAYPRCTPDCKSELRTIYKALSQDETQMVRKASAAQLGDFARVIEPQFLRSEIVPMFMELSIDDIESVRLACINACISISSALNPQELKETMKAPMMTLVLDSSWKVRQSVAQKFMEIQQSVGLEITKECLFPVFTRLLRADELEVRKSANNKIIEFCDTLPEQGRDQMILTELVPVIRGLLKDDPDVKAKPIYAKVMMELSRFVGKQKTIDVLLPIYYELLKSESTDVRISIISNMEKVNDTIGMAQLSQGLLPAILELTKDPKWRVRKAIIEHMPLIAAQLGQKFFEENLLPTYMKAITDQVFSVREAAIDILTKLVEKFGNDWTLKVLMPKIFDLSKPPNYLHRITCLQCFNVLAQACGPDFTVKHILPTIVNLSRDSVPNVRFNVAKTLEKVGPLLDQKTLNGEIKPLLTKLATEDAVFDVRFFADEARQSIL